jgi:hypothetical protein
MSRAWSTFAVLAIVLFLAFPLASTRDAGVSTGNVLFSDDFETYSVGSFPSQWRLVFNGMGNQYQQVISDPTDAANKCFQLQGERNWAADAVRYFQSSADQIGFEVSILVTANTGTPADDVKVGLWKQVNWGQAKWTDGVAFTDNGTIVARDFVEAEGTGTVLQNYVVGQWYHIRFILDRPTQTISVYVDGVLKGELIKGSNLPYVFDGFALSGRYTEIPVDYDNVKIFEASASSAELRQESALTVFATSDTSQSDFNVQIQGNLTANGGAIANAPILLSYSVNGGKSWVDLALVQTNADGKYYAQWKPSVTGHYALKAIYEGNNELSNTTAAVNFIVEPYSQQSVFSVNSNSTLSEFAFNSTSRELRFSVSGNSGTSGYVYVTIPKSLVTDISTLAVYLDGNQTQYAYTTHDDSYLLYFSYHHSSHIVDIRLDGAEAEAWGLGLLEIAILVFMGVIAVVAIIAVAKSLRKMPDSP